MSQFGDFIEKVYNINESSAKYASNLQRVNGEVISKANIFNNSVKPLFDFVSKLKLQMIDILPFSYSANLMPLLRPIFEALGSDLEEEIVSDLESFRLSVFWRFKPLTDIIDNIVGGLREESRQIILNRRKFPTYSIQPEVYPITSEEQQITSNRIGPTSQFGYLLSSRTPKITIRRDVDYSDYDIKGGKVTSEVETKDKMPLKGPLEVPIISLIPKVVHIRRSFTSVSEERMAKLSSTLSQFYTPKVSDWSRVPFATLSQLSDIGKFNFSIPTIKRGLHLLSAGEVDSFITEFPFDTVSSIRYAEK